jgi:hypothetical protein
VLYGRLLDKNSYRCEPLTDLSYPVVLLQGGESRGDRFREGLRGNLYGVLNVSKISDRNRARSKNHMQEGNIFVFCSPARPVAILQAGSRGVISSKPVSGPRGKRRHTAVNVPTVVKQLQGLRLTKTATIGYSSSRRDVIALVGIGRNHTAASELRDGSAFMQKF